jgi:predicted Zn-dependent protease
VAAPGPPSLPAPVSLEQLARDAEAARAAGRLEKAAAIYRRGLEMQPGWAEGLWGAGSVAYERNEFAACREASSRLTIVNPKMAAAWALRGLCEFQVGAYRAAGTHLARGLSLGLGPSEELGRAVLYYQALVLVRLSQFDAAIAPLQTVLRFQAATPELEQACGLVLLRRPVLPAAVPSADQDLVAAAGGAYCAHLARHPEDAVSRFRALIAAHPRERYLHYGCGLALAQQGSAEALDLYREEVELFPDDVLARVELSFGLLGQGRAKEAVAPAREAVRLAPHLFVTHLVLGRALVDAGDVAAGVRELETAAAQAPAIPAVHLALARGYQIAGRRAEAARARAAFQSLEEARRGSDAGAPERP